MLFLVNHIRNYVYFNYNENLRLYPVFIQVSIILIISQQLFLYNPLEIHMVNIQISQYFH